MVLYSCHERRGNEEPGCIDGKDGEHTILSYRTYKRGIRYISKSSKVRVRQVFAKLLLCRVPSVHVRNNRVTIGKPLPYFFLPISQP